MINKKEIERFFSSFLEDAVVRDFRPLGSGAHGTGYSLQMETPQGLHDYVIKILEPANLGHDYPSDRAAVFLLALAEYGNLPNHVKAIDVIAQLDDGSLKSVGGGKEYYLLMERARGTSYFTDLESFRGRGHLLKEDAEKIEGMTSYLAKIHAVKKTSKALYWRKLRDIVGHGECLMGVFDTYPPSTINEAMMALIEKKCIDWRYRLRSLTHRLSLIHGDFHPGNIWFQNGSFALLDRSRGPYGEPADDVTALTINYIFFSLKDSDRCSGAYQEAFTHFFRSYIEKTNDQEIVRVTAPFFAFRGAVVANPVFYPDIDSLTRKRLFTFIMNVLEDNGFDYEDVNSYLEG